MRSVSATLISSQKLSTGSRTPYIHLLLTSYDGLTTYDFSTDSSAYGNRIRLIDHVENAYSDYATIVISNYDGAFDDFDLRGYWTEIGYGDTTGAGDEYAATARLWVKHQQLLYLAGRQLLVLELEGMWSKLNERLLALGSPPLYIAKTSAAVGEEEYVAGFSGASLTVYDLISYILGLTIPAFTLAALTDDDGVIDTLIPTFSINEFQPFESAGELVYALLKMTYSFLRPKPTLQFEVVYPQTSEAVDITYYRTTSPFFYEFLSRLNVDTPNHIILFANAGADELWADIITAVAQDAAQQALYGDVPEVALAPAVTTQADADTRAAAILARSALEEITGRLVVPHDCQIELYDYIGAVSS